MDYEFCLTCGTLKERGLICKACSTIIRSKERREKIARDSKKLNEIQIKKKIIKESTKKKPKFSPKAIARYSESGGLEFEYQIDPEIKRTRLNFCIKCKKSKLCYAGWWIKAGGKYASSESRKRIFICSDCWKPNKSKVEDE